MSVLLENRDRLEAHWKSWKRKPVTLAGVVRSKRRGKIELVIRQPSFVAAAPRGEHNERSKTINTACTRAPIQERMAGPSARSAAGATHTAVNTWPFPDRCPPAT